MDSANMPILTSDMEGHAVDALRALPVTAWRLRAAAFIALLGGTAASFDRLAELCGTSAAQTEFLCRAMRDVGGLEVDGRLVVTAAGLTARSTEHLMTIAGRRRFAVCALDAFAIPAALPDPVAIRSVCRLCRAPVEGYYEAGLAAGGSPDLLFWIPCQRIVHLQDDFCGKVALFCSDVHLNAWHSLGGRGRGRIRTLPEVESLGRSYWGRVLQLGGYAPRLLSDLAGAYAEVRP